MTSILKVALIAGLSVVPSLASAQNAPAVSIELNKVTDQNGACRTTFVADNGLGADIDKLSLDVVVFDNKGEVAQRLLLDLGRMQKQRTKVVEFDLPNTSCGKLSRLLLNQVQECSSGGNPVPGCADHVDTSTKVPKLPFDN